MKKKYVALLVLGLTHKLLNLASRLVLSALGIGPSVPTTITNKKRKKKEEINGWDENI